MKASINMLLSCSLLLMLLCVFGTAAPVDSVANTNASALAHGHHHGLPYPVASSVHIGAWINGAIINKTGTSVESITAELALEYPDFDPFEHKDVPWGNHPENNQLSKRYMLTGLDCIPVPGQPWKSCYLWNAYQMVNGMNSAYLFYAHPRYCNKVGSYADSRLGTFAYACNDNDFWSDIPWYAVGNVLTNILQNCDRYDWSDDLFHTGGQQFTDMGVNFIVTSDDFPSYTQ